MYKTSKKKIDVFYSQINEQNIRRFLINNKNIIATKSMTANNVSDDMLNNPITPIFASDQSFSTPSTSTFINSLALHYIKRFRKVSTSGLDLIVEKFVEGERIAIDIQMYWALKELMWPHKQILYVWIQNDIFFNLNLINTSMVMNWFINMKNKNTTIWLSTNALLSNLVVWKIIVVGISLRNKRTR